MDDETRFERYLAEELDVGATQAPERPLVLVIQGRRQRRVAVVAAFADILELALAGALLVYLVYVLIRPERF